MESAAIVHTNPENGTFKRKEFEDAALRFSRLARIFENESKLSGY